MCGGEWRRGGRICRLCHGWLLLLNAVGRDNNNNRTSHITSIWTQQQLCKCENVYSHAVVSLNYFIFAMYTAHVIHDFILKKRLCTQTFQATCGTLTDGFSSFKCKINDLKRITTKIANLCVVTMFRACNSTTTFVHKIWLRLTTILWKDRKKRTSSLKTKCKN